MNWLKRLLSQLFGSNEAKRKAKEQEIVNSVLPSVQSFADKVVTDVTDHVKLPAEAKVIVTGIVDNAINDFDPKV